MIIVESSGIGVGKTEAVKALQCRMPGSHAFFEQAGDAPLDPYYADVENKVKPSVAALKLQFFFMDTRYWAHLQGQEVEWKTRRETIFDRSIWGDYGFAHRQLVEGWLGKDDYDIYMRHRRTMEHQLLPPHAVVRLEASPDTCIKRINKRMTEEAGRKCETAVTTAYLEGLAASYEEVVWPWFKERGVPILRYEWQNGPWDFFPDIELVMVDLQKVLPSSQEFLYYNHALRDESRNHDH